MTDNTQNPVKVAIKRAWMDLAPKLLAFLTGGTAASIIVQILHDYFGFNAELGLVSFIVTIAGVVLAYFVKDTVKLDRSTIVPVEKRGV